MYLKQLVLSHTDEYNGIGIVQCMGSNCTWYTTSLAHARPMKNNGLVKLVYQTCVADISKYLKYFIEFTCGKIKKIAHIIITVWLM